MPINAPQEYYELEMRYSKEKDPEEKERILKEMMIVLPKHKGTDREFASLKRRMSLLRKEASRRPQIHKTASIRKRWPRICIVGYDAGKILKMFKLTRVGAMYHGITFVNKMPIQVVMVPNYEKFKEAVNQSEIIFSKERLPVSDLLQINTGDINIESALKTDGIIGVFTENSDESVPMPANSTVKDLARRLHIEVKKNTYAVVYGRNVKFQGQRVSLNYRLENGDRVFIKL